MFCVYFDQISVLMSPRTKSVQETGEDGSDPNTLKRSRE